MASGFQHQSVHHNAKKGINILLLRAQHVRSSLILKVHSTQVPVEIRKHGPAIVVVWMTSCRPSRCTASYLQFAQSKTDVTETVSRHALRGSNPRYQRQQQPASRLLPERTHCFHIWPPGFQSPSSKTNVDFDSGSVRSQAGVDGNQSACAM